MEYSTLEPWQEINETGLVYALGSLYDRFQQLHDPRKAKGKRYSLVTLLVLICLAKLCNQDTPIAIAEWAKNHAGELVKLLQLRHTWMPHHNTYRRVFQEVISPAEFDGNVSPTAERGDRRHSGPGWQDVARHADCRSGR